MSLLILGLLFSVVLAQPSNIKLELSESHTLKISWESPQAGDSSLIYDVADSLDDIRDIYQETDKKLSSSSEQKENVYVHSVELHELEKDEMYVYVCGGESNWSQVHSFMIPRDSSNELSFAIVGEAINNSSSSAAMSLLSSKNLMSRITGLFDFQMTARDTAENVAMSTLKANTPSFKIPNNIENEFVFTYNSIFFIFLNTREYNESKEKWLIETLLDAGDMNYIIVLGYDPVDSITFNGGINSVRNILDINGVSAYIHLGDYFKREGTCGQKETFYLQIPTLSRDSAPMMPEHTPSESLYLSESLGYGMIQSGDSSNIHFVYTGLDKNTELDTIMIPRRLSKDEESHDLIFSGAIGGMLALLAIGAIIGKCLVGGKSEVSVHYEMQQLRSDEDP